MASAFGVLLFWGGWYLATYSGSFRADVLNENPQSLLGETGPGKQLSPSSSASASTPRPRASPATSPMAKARAARCRRWPGRNGFAGPPQRIKRIVLYGLTGPITVRGQTFNSDMPPIGAKLKDEQVAARPYLHSPGMGQ